MIPGKVGGAAASFKAAALLGKPEPTPPSQRQRSLPIPIFLWKWERDERLIREQCIAEHGEMGKLGPDHNRDLCPVCEAQPERPFLAFGKPPGRAVQQKVRAARRKRGKGRK